MDILRISPSEYKQIFSNPSHVFNTVDFNELNKDKCEQIHYLVFKESKIKLGIIMGEKDGVLKSPFSAPFGGFCSNKSVEIAFYENAVVRLKQYLVENGLKAKISLPPYIYGGSFISKSFSALSRCGATLAYTDLNYQYRLENFPNYEENLERSAKKNFHNSLKTNFDFIKLDSNDETQVSRAYEVIRINRESRGFPLRMPLQAVLNTIKVIKADFFVMTYEGVDVAAAQVFHVSDGICQVIYWGDVPEYANLRVMNFFTYKVFEHYYNDGLKILDIGPSTENGIPNYGLCDFKENIGCGISLKFIFEL